MKLRPLILVFMLTLMTLTTGCFGLFGSGGPEESAMITVRNDVDPPNSMTIELRQDGDDETLGTVAPGTERAMTFRSRDLQGAYQLVARQPSGAAIVSREFTLFAGAEVRWNMRSNSVSVSQAR